MQTDVFPSRLASLTHRLGNTSALADHEVRALERLPIQIRVLAARQDIVRETEQARKCCILLEGWIYRYRTLSVGKRQILSLHLAGEVPDLHSLHLPVMDHTLAALSACTVAFVAHEDLHALIRAHPGLAMPLWHQTALDAAIFREWIVNIGRRPAIGRLAHLMCELYLRLEAAGLASGQRCAWPLTQADLADALGLTSVHINRTLKELRLAGLVTLDGPSLTIRDWTGLARLAEFNPTYLNLPARSRLGSETLMTAS